MNDTLVFTKRNSPYPNCHIRVDKELYSIISDIASVTGAPMSSVVNNMLDFSAKHIQFEDSISCDSNTPITAPDTLTMYACSCTNTDKRPTCTVTYDINLNGPTFNNG